MPPRTCCIFSDKSARSCRSSKPYEKDFELAIGPRSEGRAGFICGTCKNAICEWRKSNDETDFPLSHLLDCRVKTRGRGRVKGRHNVNVQRQGSQQAVPAITWTDSAATCSDSIGTSISTCSSDDDQDASSTTDTNDATTSSATESDEWDNNTHHSDHMYATAPKSKLSELLPSLDEHNSRAFRQKQGRRHRNVQLPCSTGVSTSTSDSDTARTSTFDIDSSTATSDNDSDTSSSAFDTDSSTSDARSALDTDGDSEDEQCVGSKRKRPDSACSDSTPVTSTKSTTQASESEGSSSEGRDSQHKTRSTLALDSTPLNPTKRTRLSSEPQMDGFQEGSSSPSVCCRCKQMIRGHPKYRRCRFSNGGDWEYEARVLGLVGPNAKQFCNHCLIKLEQLAKGEAHALHKLPKYDNTTKDFTLRSVGRCYAKSAQYKAAAARVKSTKTADFESCQSDPLIKGTTDKVIDVVSTTPLHISLGVGLHILNIMEKQAITLDNTIKADNLNQQQREIIDKIKELTEDVEVEKEKIRQVEEKANDLRNDRPEFFETTRNGHFKKKTDLAKGVRERVQNYVKEAADLQNKADKLTKQIQKQENQFDKVIKELDSVRGPFKRRFDALLDSMHLQRVAYHSGAIVGPDVHKITRNKNIKNITRIFQPIQLRNKNNVTTTYSSNDIVNKMATLMYKFKACYSLYTANRELCRHEVEILALRCTSFGCWLPTNFPEESMKRKFHVLAVEVPRQARRLQTVGMLTEQTIESLHPYINKLERMFCSTQRKQDKALLMMKQHNLFSEPCLPTLE